MGLAELVTEALKQEVSLVLNTSSPCSTSESSARELWDKFTAYRKAGFVKPFHTRRTPYKCSIHSLGGYIVKEYTGARQKVEAEIRILQQLHHESLISYEFIADEGSRISIVMAWAGVPMREHRLANAASYNEDTARHMAHQLASALSYLHGRGIVHRDIKPDNIGVLLDAQLQLFDWGEAVDLREVAPLSDKELSRRVGVAGTPLFMPPESLNHLTRRPTAEGPAAASECGASSCDGDAGPASSCGASTAGGASSVGGGCGVPGLRSTLSPALDVWGMGTVIYFVLAGRDIFLGDSSWELEELADVVNCSSGVSLPEGASASYAARDFLHRCLERCPARRATADELLRHPWLRGAATCQELEAARVADAVVARRLARRCGSASGSSVASRNGSTAGSRSGGGRRRAPSVSGSSVRSAKGSMGGAAGGRSVADSNAGEAVAKPGSVQQQQQQQQAAQQQLRQMQQLKQQQQPPKQQQSTQQLPRQELLTAQRPQQQRRPSQEPQPLSQQQLQEQQQQQHQVLHEPELRRSTSGGNRPPLPVCAKLSGGASSSPQLSKRSPLSDGVAVCEITLC